jgi:hypothetical protein
MTWLAVRGDRGSGWKDGTRAAEIINRMRALFKKGAPEHE